MHYLPDLSEHIINKIRRADNDCSLSIAGAWETAIKSGIRKLVLKTGFNNITGILPDHNIGILDVEFADLNILLNLLFLQKEPFATVKFAQAMANGSTVLTKGDTFGHYPVKSVW